LSRQVAGVDGCRGGWICVLWEPDAAEPARVLLASSFTGLLDLPEAPAVIAVDMPIGLPAVAAKGGRACDNAARRNLGDRQSALFAVPARAAVAESDYAKACAAALANSEPPRKVSKQCFNLFGKIRELDALMTPDLQSRVFECHPETAFWAMNGRRPLTEPKKVKSQPYPPGLKLRRQLLESAGFSAAFLEGSRFPRSRAGADDLLDACACAWTAARIRDGVAICFPEEASETDVRGLRMAIWA
jgi:predicted RNase H-like nuclease